METPCPLSSLLKSDAGTCSLCRQKAGILSREHPGRRRTHQPGRNGTVNLAADVVVSHTFDEKLLRLNLSWRQASGERQWEQ